MSPPTAAPSCDTPDFRGLTAAQVRERMAQDGPNALPEADAHGIARLVLEVVREPMFLLLLAATAIYLVLGDLHEALLLLFFVCVVMGITLYQSRKTERVLQALRDLSSPRALVVRDGEKQRIAGHEVVRDDIVFLAEGDRVPADALLLMGNGLQIDESLLTGEAVPVRKAPCAAAPPPPRPGGDDTPMVYSGTLVVQGQGIARVTATGPRTEMGRIGTSLEALRPGPSPMQRQVRALMWLFALLGAVLCGAVVVLYGLTRGGWLDALLAGITLAISLLPQEFLVVLTVFLALGAWRISRSRVLTRRIPALETLGAATVLCADKTGTITENRMAVAQLLTRDGTFRVDDGEGGELPECFHELVEFSVLASLSDPFDPMERAFRRLADRYLAGTEHLHDDWTLVQHYPLSREMLAMSHGWQATRRDEFVVAAKGAPEAIADLCHFSAADTAALAEQVDRLAKQGLRVLAVARATFAGTRLPPIQHDFPFVFLGMIALTDRVRARVPESIRLARQAGVRVAMITGDYPGTAEAVAREAGIDLAGGILTGADIGRLDDAALQERLRATHVFARVMPEQKLRLVEAFKANGEVVAMTGDGVNDAPALKAAHIGIAMGGRGTDVAREAASLVLLDDDFSAIVDAIRLGRRIFANLHKAMAYILAVHVPIAGMALLPLLFGLPLVLAPVHIVFLELVIDPACSIVFEGEPEEAGSMQRPPRRPDVPLFSLPTLLLSLLQGATVFLAVAAMYAFALQRGEGADTARALTFATLVAGNLWLILVNRSWSTALRQSLRVPNVALWRVVAGTLAFLGCALYVPWLRDVFGFGVLHVDDLLLVLAAGGIGVAWFELFKWVRRARGGRR
ncbi:cation-translocating P-type ATPase [Thiobacillus sedimenti]|uniref:Cation-translocating P-type ATPase n=1 Tax=Thiobacillus sedimenti TaxID=3110231 RepID=A0ABZ1CEX0_9PROT|nr:cation-translocating P-type ATPase [Thiobacillus sp. SCUT-2]WRS37921.1 cation-translocating P-type ATPase [Thiobacillus sp. SCUT-2]